MQTVTLEQMLEARERRAQRQRELTAQFGLPLVSFTMNIPGPVKNSPLIRRGFRLGERCLTELPCPALISSIRRSQTP